MQSPKKWLIASLAGLAAGVWTSLEELEGLRRSQHVFLPQRGAAECAEDYRQWRRAVERSRQWMENDGQTVAFS